VQRPVQAQRSRNGRRVIALSAERRLPSLLVRALAVGLLSGAAAILLRWAATEAPHLLWPDGGLVAGVVAATPLRRVLIPALGGLAAGLVLALGSRLAGAARGWDILEAVVLRDGHLPLRPALVRGASSLVTQASAGAVGREGPIVLLAAAVASVLGIRTASTTRERRILVGCGAAAGLACAYNTPLGAALFTMEILFGSVALDAFAPLAVASAVSTALAWAAFGRDPVFRVAEAMVESPWEVVLYAFLGLLGGLVAAAFLVVLRASAALFRRSRLARPVAMALAGLALGVATLRYPEVVGNGREAIAALFERPWGLEHVLALLALRLLLTPLAVGSGTVGGVFTPTLFLGAMLGQAFGVTVHHAAPGLGTPPAVYALAGMGCLLAGTTHAPLTSVVMVFEMTLDYGVVVPLLVGAAVASVVARRLSPASVYTEALERKAGASVAAELALDVRRVADFVRQEQVTVAEDADLPALLDAFVRERRNHLYVVDASGAFVGAVNLHDVNEALRGASDPRTTRARDVLQPRFETTTPFESLPRVLERFAAQDSERLPVLAPDGSRRLVGTIAKRDVLAAYARELLAPRALGDGG
jgi:CIC family chloride channel protein